MFTPVIQLGDAIEDSSRRIGHKGRYDLGVLLVHGIGEQARGDTLISQGDPFVRWLRGRVGAGNKPHEPKVDVLDSVVRHASTDAIPGAHAVIRITPGITDPAAPPDPAHWVVAEAWWAEAFRQATFGELIGWAISVGPFVFATEVSGIARRMEIGDNVPPALRLALIPITLIVGATLVLVAAVASFLVTVIAIALVIVALTRIPFFADFARSLQLNLASGFGDAYVLTRSPLRFAAMAGQVRAGLKALRQQCSAVAVIAESMGTAVAWYGLKHELIEPDDYEPDDSEKSVDSKPAPIGLWLTHGQALRKLTFVLTMARGAQTDRHTILAVATAAFLGLAVLAFILAAPWPLVVVPIGLAVAFEIALLASAAGIWTQAGQDIEADWLNVLQVAPDLDWLDLWASADPFALGPLDVNGDRISSYKIRNVGSPIADHTSYWTNTTEFLPIVASYLFRLGGPQQYASRLDDAMLEVPAMRRHARVLALLPLRFVVGVGIAMGLLYAWLNPALGRTLIDFVASLNVPFVDGFFESPPDWVVALAGYLLIAAIGAIAWGVISLLWNGLMRGEERTYFRGKSAPLWTLPWYLFIVLVIPVVIAIGLAFLLVDEPLMTIGFVLASAFLSALGLAVLSGGGTTYASDEGAQRTIAATRAISPKRAAAVIGATLLIAMILVAIPLVTWLWFGDAFPLVIGAEIVVLSLVLAIEALREYRVFVARFNRRNKELPER